MKKEAEQQIKNFGIIPDEIKSSADLMNKLAGKNSRLHELCKCLTKTPERKYHEEYCPVWKNGRIAELEKGLEQAIYDYDIDDLQFTELLNKQ